jgi:hypothetical protein
VTVNELAGSFWPNDRQKLLLRTALMEGEPSAEAWHRVRPSFDLDDPDPASQSLLPLVYRQLSRLGIEDPGFPKLRGIYRRTWYANQLLLERLKEALAAVEGGGGDPLVVSSWELPLRYYGDLGLRPVTTLNLLVRPNRVGRSAQALCDQGWTGPVEPSESFLRSRHYARYERANGDKCFVYWGIFHEFSDPGRGLEPEDLWGQPIDLELRGVPARALSPTDELLNVCVGGARPKSWPTVIWVADAIAVLRAPDSAIDWQRLVRQATRLRATLRVHDAASFLRQELDAPVPAEVLEELREARMSRREVLAHRAAGTRFGPLGATPDTLTRFLRLTSNVSVPRALVDLPRFLRDEWGLERRSQVPLAALRKSATRIAGAARVLGKTAQRRSDVAGRPRTHERTNPKQ